MGDFNSGIIDSMSSVLIEDCLDPHVMRMWSAREFAKDMFYQTGFETILFNKNRSFALETVLSSVISWDDEVLIVGFGAILGEMESKADSQGVFYQSYNWVIDGWSSLENVIEANGNIKKILIGIEAETEVDDIPIEKLLALATKNKIGIIVYCQTDVDGLNDRFKGAIDFMIGECDCHPHRSFVVARRSKLVQTEGVSQSFNFDLYAYWQWSMRNRNSIIEPMFG